MIGFLIRKDQIILAVVDNHVKNNKNNSPKVY